MLVTGNIKGKTVVYDIPETELAKFASFELVANEEELKGDTEGLEANYGLQCKGVYSKTC